MAHQADRVASVRLLKTENEASPSWPDEAYSSDSEPDLDGPATYEENGTPGLRGGWTPSKGKQNAKPRPGGHPSRRKGGWLRNNKPLLIVCAISLGGLLAILGMLFGGVFEKPKAPPDGVSDLTCHLIE